MSGLLLAIHIFVCILLIAAVLIQTGKGAEIGAVFGGGASTTLFGPAGPAGLLIKVTVVLAIIFMVTSLLFTTIMAKPPTKSIVDQPPPLEVPMQK